MSQKKSKPKVPTKAELLAQRKEVEELEQLLRLKEGLPHLYGQKFYPWARRVWDSTNKEIFLCSANQVGKSCIAIRKNIRLATDPSLWPKYWPNLPKGQAPNLFFYFYPTFPLAQLEYESKWEAQFLPKGEYKNHPQYGWTAEFEKGLISKIRFNTGVVIVFRAYSMKLKDLQASSVYHLTCDEECPVEYLPELKARLNSTDGCWVMVFTATMGQLHWKQTMEPSSPSEEKHKEALKIQVSLYDSKFFDDGTASHWTDRKIQQAIANCPTESEIQRRVFGRFVKSSGLMFESFDLKKNLCEPKPLAKDWPLFSGVDVGSGGQSGHPSSITFLTVSPDFKQGFVFRGWRGDGIPTTATDILDKYRELKGKLVMTAQVYDGAAKDFHTVATRQGEAFVPADKTRDAGVGLVNTLFKNGMLKIFTEDPELEKLVQELASLGVDQPKRKALDDFCDSLRYACMAVPWDFSDIQGALSLDEALRLQNMPIQEKTGPEVRREYFLGLNKTEPDDTQQEFDFWNDFLGASNEY